MIKQIGGSLQLLLAANIILHFNSTNYNSNSKLLNMKFKFTKVETKLMFKFNSIIYLTYSFAYQNLQYYNEFLIMYSRRHISR